MSSSVKGDIITWSLCKHLQKLCLHLNDKEIDFCFNLPLVIEGTVAQCAFITVSPHGKFIIACSQQPLKAIFCFTRRSMFGDQPVKPICSIKAAPWLFNTDKTFRTCASYSLALSFDGTKLAWIDETDYQPRLYDIAKNCTVNLGTWKSTVNLLFAKW